MPGFSCCHYLLSDLLSGKISADPSVSLRLVDETATLLMSVIILIMTAVTSQRIMD